MWRAAFGATTSCDPERRPAGPGDSRQRNNASLTPVLPAIRRRVQPDLPVYQYGNPQAQWSRFGGKQRKNASLTPRLPVRGVVVRVEGEEAQPVTFTVGNSAEPATDPQRVEAVTVRPDARQDGLPAEAAIGVDLLP